MIYKTLTVGAQLTGNQINANADFSGDLSVQAEMINRMDVNTVSNYDLLTNKPQINSVELVGNRSLDEIGVDSISNIELENILK